MSTRNLTRSRNRWILGVCGGIADYFGIDPLIVRVLFIVSPFITFGVSVIVYLVLAIIMGKPRR